MAEKGIIVSDAATGESVACRDAVELDNESNARVIQRVDIGKGVLPAPFRDAANLLRDGVNADGSDAANYSSNGVYDAVLTVGDKSTLVVQVQSMDSFTGKAVIIPILLEADGTTIQGTLEPVEFDFVASGDKIKLVGGAYDNFHIMPNKSWDVLGSCKIAIAVMSNNDPYATLDIYGAVI